MAKQGNINKPSSTQKPPHGNKPSKPQGPRETYVQRDSPPPKRKKG